MKRRWSTGIFAALGMLVLIIDSKTAVMGAQRGLQMCIQGVIPSLMPFIFLSQLLVNSMIGHSNRVFGVIERILRIPKGSGSIYVAGLLGGYPTGAQLAAQACRDGLLPRQAANRMLFFCSNAGPAFLFGMLSGAFSDTVTLWVLWLIHIASSVFIAMIIPVGNIPRIQMRAPADLTYAAALKRTLLVAAQICGWVLLFKVLCTFTERWFLFAFSNELQLCITGMLELTAGCMGLMLIENEGLRMILCSGILAFGGLCVVMQTAAVSGELEMNNYIFGKILQCMISICLTSVLQYFLMEDDRKLHIPLPFWVVIFLTGLVFSVFLRKKEKNSSISPPDGVQLVA